MAAFVEEHHRAAIATGWLDRLKTLLARELAPSPRRFWTSLRLTLIATIGAGLIVSCHVKQRTWDVHRLAAGGRGTDDVRAQGDRNPHSRGAGARLLSGDGAGAGRNALAHAAVFIRIHGAYHLWGHRMAARHGCAAHPGS